MIISKSINVKNLVKQKRDLEKFHQELNDMRETTKSLEQVFNQVIGLKDLYMIVYADVSATNQQKVKYGIKDTIEQVQYSKKDFSSARRQANTLKVISNNLSRLRADTEVSWKLAAEQILQPYFELFNLVQQLPEFRTQGPQLFAWKDKLSGYITNIPKNIVEMRDFKERLSKFKSAISSVEGITPEVRDFLAKVANGTAVLADMDEKILEWCRQSDRSRVFQIKFKS
jgi:hypothetical protein